MGESPAKAAVSGAETLLRIVQLGKGLWDQKQDGGSRAEEVGVELNVLTKNLEQNIQLLGGNTLVHNNAATWANEALVVDLRDAAKEAHKILGKGFFDSVWDAEKVCKELRLLRERVVTPFQMAILFTALNVEIESPDNKEEFESALSRVQGLLKALTSSSAASLKDVLQQGLQGMWQPVRAEMQAQKMDEALFFLKATEPQTDGLRQFFSEIVAELEAEKSKREAAAAAAAAAAAPSVAADIQHPASSKSKKIPSTDTLKWYHDPVTWEVMCDPVKGSDGRTYDRWTFIDNAASMKRSPFDRREDRLLKIEFDDIDVRSRLFHKFPEQEEKFRRRRREYRAEALRLAGQRLCGEALVMLHNVLAWAEDDEECKAKKQELQRRFPNLTPDKVAEFKEAFATFDRDGDGGVTIDELGVALRLLGDSPGPAQLQAMMHGADVNGDGVIDILEFLDLMYTQHERTCQGVSGPDAQPAQRQLTLEEIARLKEAFMVFDRNGDGYITVQEMGTAMRLLGHSLSAQELEALVAEADADGNGTLDFAEFLSLMTGGGSSSTPATSTQRHPQPQAVVHLTPLQVLHFTELFGLFDGDGDGSITARELSSALRLLGQAPTEAQIAALIGEGDLDGNGSLNLAEFLLVMAAATEDASPPAPAPAPAAPPPTPVAAAPLPVPQLSPREIAVYRDKFNLLDRDGDGSLTASELGTLLRLLGQSVGEEEAAAYITEGDLDGNGTLEFGEFLNLMGRLGPGGAQAPRISPQHLEELRAQFRMYDRDGDGRVTLQELATGMSYQGDYTHAQIMDLMRRGDANRDGMLDFAEFLTLMVHLSSSP